MPRLDSSHASTDSYTKSLVSLFSTRSSQPRREIVRSILLRSVRVRIFGNRNSYLEDEEGRLDGISSGTIPLRVRPAFIFLNALVLVGLGILGFHPRGQAYVPINDKILHFICFLFATGLFYCIWDVDEPARRVWIWRHIALILTWITCFAAGGLGSEMVQSLLPYKTFSWGDVFANFLGSGVGLFFSHHFERRYRTRREIARLYEPLDQEIYGDDDEDDHSRDEDEADLARNIWKSAEIPQRFSDTRFNNKSSPDAKKVRFGEHTTTILHDDSHKKSKPPQNHQSSDLFRIDDEDDVDEGTTDVWKDNTS